MGSGWPGGGAGGDRDRFGGAINLASQPFVNARPVVRTAVALWLVGAVLLVWAGLRFYGYYAGRADQRAEIAAIETSMGEERRTIAGLERQLAGLSLDNQNDRVAFLNQRIAERTFSWSLLFDRLAGILPDDVRLLTLAPQFDFGESRSRRRGDAMPAAEGVPTRVLLHLQGTAKSSEALLSLIDALFADPAFERPNPHQESRQGAESQFSLSVTYLPGFEPAASLAVADDPGVDDPDSDAPAVDDTVADAPEPAAAAEAGAAAAGPPPDAPGGGE